MIYNERQKIIKKIKDSELSLQLITLIKNSFDINVRNIEFNVDTSEDISIMLNTMYLEDNIKYYQVFKNDFNSIREGGPKNYLFNEEINNCIKNYFSKDDSLKIFINNFFVWESNFENGYRNDILADICYKFNKIYLGNKKMEFCYQYNCVKDIHDLVLVIKNKKNINGFITFYQDILPEICNMVVAFDTENLLKDKITFVIVSKEKLTCNDFRNHYCEFERQDILFSEKIHLIN